MLTISKLLAIGDLPVYSWKEWCILFFSLGKIRISLLATLTAVAGFVLAPGPAAGHIVLTTIAVLLMAFGSCGLNQFQERGVDALMERTKGRVLPSKRLSPPIALTVSLGAILSGSLLLLFGASPVALTLGLFAVLWYNGVYTYLKKKTAFAVMPGALIGPIPPLLGWVSGGGSLLDPRIPAVALFFFIWQVPHFWLLLLGSGGDYDRAGFPSLAKIWTGEQLKRIIFIWMLSTALSSLLIPLFGFLEFYPVRILLLMAMVWLVRSAIYFFKSSAEEVCFRFAFMRLNLYVLLVIAALFLDRLLTPFFSVLPPLSGLLI